MKTFKKKSKKESGAIGTVGRNLGQFRVWDMPSTFASIGSGIVSKDYTQLAQGTEYYNRVGRRVVIDHVDICATLVGGQNNSVADDPYNTICLALVVGVAGTAPANWTVGLPIGPQLTQYVREVLWTKRYVVNTNAKDSTGYVANAMLVKERIPVHLPFEYVTNTDVVATSQSLYLLCISDSIAVVNPGFNSGYLMVAFHD